MRNVFSKFSSFEIEHKIFAFAFIVCATIGITRLLVWIHDPNPVLFHFELHHFDYGLLLLIIVSIMLLFDVLHKALCFLFTAIAVGLIVDEYWFIRDGQRYQSTLLSAVILSLVIICILLFVNALIKKNF